MEKFRIGPDGICTKIDRLQVAIRYLVRDIAKFKSMGVEAQEVIDSHPTEAFPGPSDSKCRMSVNINLATFAFAQTFSLQLQFLIKRNFLNNLQRNPLLDRWITSIKTTLETVSHNYLLHSHNNFF